MSLLKLVCSTGFSKKIVSKIFKPRSLPASLFGLTFRNPVGLGAGFDKNAQYLTELDALGFGFVEIGTVTPRPQPGNEKPRVFRLIRDKALINRMGFNNEGVNAVADRLKKWRKRSAVRGGRQEETSTSRMLVGGNIGKNKNTPNEEAWKDYEICFRALHPHVDFFIVNVSSPNTPGLRALQEKTSLQKILAHLQHINLSFDEPKPILLKIAPDLEREQIDDVIDLAREINLEGLVATNTTISREPLKASSHELQTIGAGGLSGKPLQKRATEVARYIHQKTGGSIPLVASGGIFSGTDAREKMDAGASLVEVWTGFIYEGPFIVKRICSQLA